MISQTVNGLERRVVFKPGFHKIHEDPKQNYGVHGMEIWLYVIGPEGAVHFGMMTPLYLKETIKWQKEQGHTPMWHSLLGIDVGYHAKVPQREGQEPVWPTERRRKDESIPEIHELPESATHEEKGVAIMNVEWVKIGNEAPVCELIGVPCYSDGSALRAQEWQDIFLEQGDDKIFEMLEEEYHHRFSVKE